MAQIYGVTLNYAGVRAVMREPGVRDELLKRMERVSGRANSGGSSRLHGTHSAYMDPRPSDQLPVARVGSTEAEALYVESSTGYLSASLDAARGE